MTAIEARTLERRAVSGARGEVVTRSGERTMSDEKQSAVDLVSAAYSQGISDGQAMGQGVGVGYEMKEAAAHDALVAAHEEVLAVQILGHYDVTKQRDELLAALKDCLEVAFDGPSEPKGTGHESVGDWKKRVALKARAAIAKVEAGR